MTARHFEMWRDHDISGVSGEGLVAEGWQYDVPLDVRFPDGSLLSMGPGWCRVVWHGTHRSVVLWPTFDAAEAVHGHGGATRFVWTGRTADTDSPAVCSVEFNSKILSPTDVRKLRGE